MCVSIYLYLYKMCTGYFPFTILTAMFIICNGNWHFGAEIIIILRKCSLSSQSTLLLVAVLDFTK